MRNTLVVFCVYLSSCLGSTAVAVAGPTPPATAIVEFLYVGQGDATLIRSPEGRVALIDAGPGDEIATLLRERGVSAIDLVILTHRHVDHFGAMDAILKDIPVGQIIENGSPSHNDAYDRLLKIVAARHIPVRQPGEASETIALGSVRLRVFPLPPLTPDESGRLPGGGADENDRSIGVRVEYGDVSFLITGDSESAERSWWLAHADPSLYRNATILKLAHHGAKAGVDEAWLAATNPQAAVVSFGLEVIWRNWKMPAAEVVELLRKRDLRLHSTAMSGSIAVRTDGQSWEIFKERRDTTSALGWRWAQYALLACYVGVFVRFWSRRVPRSPFPGYRFILVPGLLVLVLYDVIGSTFGLSDLFWHDGASTQFLAGVSVAVLALLVARLALTVDRVRAGASIDAPDIRLSVLDIGLAMFWLILPAVLLPVFTRSQNWSISDPLNRLWLPAGMLSALMVSKVAARQSDSRLARSAAAVLTSRLTWFACAIPIAAIVVLVLTHRAYPPAAVSICLLLAAAAIPLSATRRMPLRRVIALGLVLLWVAFATGRDPYRLRFAGLDTYYEERSLVDISFQRGAKDGLRGAVESQGRPGQDSVTLQSDQEVLDRWLDRQPDRSRYPLVVLSVSGGGIAAAVWTALCLDELNETVPGFAEHVRLITGASGGMVAAAHFAAALSPPVGATGPRTPGRVTESIDRDFLTPVASHIALGGLPSLLWPWALNNDRGRVLESAWERGTGGSLAMPFSSLSKGEADGWRPSLIVTPMMVEEGRPLIVSNLNLEYLDEIELFKLFPAATGLRLSTVLRMNAAFPFVTPAATLPTRPLRHVVDAGYYDNYGVRTAAAWLARHQEWLRTNTSRVLLIQIRAYPLVSSDDGRAVGYLQRSLQGTTTPLEGYAAAKKHAMIERNDSLVASLQDSFQRSVQDQHFFTSVVIECQEEAALSWSLSHADRRRLKDELHSAENEHALELIQSLLGAKRQRQGSIVIPKPD